MPGKHWKWRMHNAAIGFAKDYHALENKPDLILASDMLDLSLFKALTKVDVPCCVYFHENQITYPWSPTDKDVDRKRDHHYGFINYTSALVADIVFFNSTYHKDSFIKGLKEFLKMMPDQKNLDTIDLIESKSEVLYLGMDLKSLASAKKEFNRVPVLLWNHRWEYDKNPDDFFRALLNLGTKGFQFKLIVLGESFAKSPSIFKEAPKLLSEKLLHFGYAEDRGTYINLLQQADILPVSSNQDFFGGSIVEAIYAGAYPLLPDRLTYPELIPQELHEKYIYKNTMEEALEHLLMNWKTEYEQHDLQKHFQRFDWELIIKEYDSRLASAAKLL